MHEHKMKNSINCKQDELDYIRKMRKAKETALNYMEAELRKKEENRIYNEQDSALKAMHVVK